VKKWSGMKIVEERGRQQDGRLCSPTAVHRPRLDLEIEYRAKYQVQIYVLDIQRLSACPDPQNLVDEAKVFH